MMIDHAKRTRGRQAAAVVGVDAGKYSHTLVVRPKDQPDSKPVTFATTRADFDRAVATIHALAPGARPEDMLVGIEFAGSCGHTLAHYLHQRGFPVVSVLPADTKRWKETAHGIPLKTDAKDALGITDLVWQGKFVGFPFLQPAYAELRALVNARDRLVVLRKAALTRIKSNLHTVWPEFERIFPNFTKKTPLTILEAFPGPEELRGATKARVMKVLATASRGHLGEERYQTLREAAKHTLALPHARETLKGEIRAQIAQFRLYEAQLAELEARMAAALAPLPEAAALQTIPNVAPVTAAVFLGSIGDPRSYSSGREILRVAGLTLVEKSSGLHRGRQRISKRGRPSLRQMAYMFAVRSIRQDGLYRREYEALYARNGGKGTKALVAVMRSALCLMFAVARDQRRFTAAPPARPAHPAQSARAARGRANESAAAA
jgi:transposase